MIGGATLPVYNLGQEVARVLSHRFQNKHFFDTLEEFATFDMARSQSADGPSTVLCLTDLDRPYLEDLTVAHFAALKTLWAIAGTVVWVTCGSRKDNPYSHMMKGIINTVKTEHPNLSVQMYDLDCAVSAGSGTQQNTATDLAVALLREHILHEWGPDSNLLWTQEPEIFVSDGKQLITRLLPDLDKNKRYNSQRREVFTTADPVHETLELVGIGRGKERSLELHKVSPLSLSVPPAAEYRTVRITYSLLQSLAIGGAGFLRLCTGIDQGTGETVLALTGSSESPAKVPAPWCISFPKKVDASTLISIATNLMPEHILSLTPRGSTLLVNEGSLTLQAALRAKATGKNVNTAFKTAELRQDEDDASIFLHPNFPQHVIQATIPSSVAVFVHFSHGAASDAVRDAITKCLTPTCLMISEEAVLSHKVKPSKKPETAMTLAQMLQKASDDPRMVAREIECIHLENVNHHMGSGEPLAAVDWTASPRVTAKVQPIDSGMLFRADNTYLFVGMAGELGQSLAEWTIKHGARNVVLTSRTPKVNPRFVEDMEKRYGALVIAMSLDVTSGQSLENILNAITATLPRISGIINGARVLEDELFANMTLENFTRVTAPKVLGTQLLDQAFHDDTSLDFFIVTSSIASIIGWTGQSNYSAANEWMSSLVCNRRERGVPASTMKFQRSWA